MNHPTITRACPRLGVRALVLAAAVTATIAAVPAHALPVVFAGTGEDAAAVQPVVDVFRAALGTNNGVGVCSGACVPGVGRREVNWDGVPDAFASGGANAFPGNFFNLDASNPAARVRGIEFTSAGAFEVSAREGNPTGTPVLFGNHTPDNADDFAAFSPERIFGLVGSNILDVTFAVPGSPGQAATVRGFGAVFTDVEVAGGTALDFYDLAGELLLHLEVPAFGIASGESFNSFSFAGALFDSAQVARVRITNGGFDLALNRFGDVDDAVAMDDFIYAEPVGVGLPGTLPLLALAFGAVGWRSGRARGRPAAQA